MCFKYEAISWWTDVVNSPNSLIQKWLTLGWNLKRTLKNYWRAFILGGSSLYNLTARVKKIIQNLVMTQMMTSYSLGKNASKEKIDSCSNETHVERFLKTKDIYHCQLSKGEESWLLWPGGLWISTGLSTPCLKHNSRGDPEHAESFLEVPNLQHTSGTAQKLWFVWDDSCLTLLWSLYRIQL